MKFILTAIGIMIALAHKPVDQQPKTITITVTVAKAELILKALAKLPYEESADLIQDITTQGQKQLADTSKIKK